MPNYPYTGISHNALRDAALSTQIAKYLGTLRTYTDVLVPGRIMHRNDDELPEYRRSMIT